MNEMLPKPDVLTKRQEAIAWALVRRTPIKQIAADLGISPSTVNDHIKSLKRKFGVARTADLVAALLETYSFPTNPNGGGIEKRVSQMPQAVSEDLRDGRDLPHLTDVLTATPVAAQTRLGEPRVIPEEFDGPDGLMSRLVAIAKIVAFILAAAVLAILAMDVVTGLVEEGGLSTP